MSIISRLRAFGFYLADTIGLVRRQPSADLLDRINDAHRQIGRIKNCDDYALMDSVVSDLIYECSKEADAGVLMADLEDHLNEKIFYKSVLENRVQ